METVSKGRMTPPVRRDCSRGGRQVGRRPVYPCPDRHCSYWRIWHSLPSTSLNSLEKRGRCRANRWKRLRSQKGSLMFGWMETSALAKIRVAGRGSSLTVFFVDLHQGLVGLLCSRQAVLRLGEEAARSGHWTSPAVALPPPRDPAPSTVLSRQTKHRPPGGPTGCAPLAFPSRLAPSPEA